MGDIAMEGVSRGACLLRKTTTNKASTLERGEEGGLARARAGGCVAPRGHWLARERPIGLGRGEKEKAVVFYFICLSFYFICLS